MATKDWSAFMNDHHERPMVPMEEAESRIKTLKRQLQNAENGVMFWEKKAEELEERNKTIFGWSLGDLVELRGMRLYGGHLVTLLDAAAPDKLAALELYIKVLTRNEES